MIMMESPSSSSTSGPVVKCRRSYIYRGYCYRMERTLRNDAHSLRCVRNLCKGRIHVYPDDTVKEKCSHHHEPDKKLTNVRLSYLDVIAGGQTMATAQTDNNHPYRDNRYGRQRPTAEPWNKCTKNVTLNITARKSPSPPPPPPPPPPPSKLFITGYHQDDDDLFPLGCAEEVIISSNHLNYDDDSDGGGGSGCSVTDGSTTTTTISNTNSNSSSVQLEPSDLFDDVDGESNPSNWPWPFSPSSAPLIGDFSQPDPLDHV